VGKTVPTGYGSQTALFAPLLAEHYDIAISSFYGLEGAPIRWKGIPVLPGLTGEWGNQSLVPHAKHFFGGGNSHNGLVFTLMDVWVLDTKIGKETNLICWTPVDHNPAPPKVTQFLIESEAIPVAMSRFGERQLGLLDPLYCPHAVDTKVFKPMDSMAAREASFPDGAFVVGMIAANKGRPSRKGFSQGMQAFAEFAKRHEEAHLYLHTTLDPNWAQGENLAALMQHLEIPDHRVRVADQYTLMFEPYTDTNMAQIYSALNVLMNPAHGEGFGIPVLEAQACGVPAIVTDWTAMPEVCGAGWTVEARRTWTGQESWWGMPDVPDLLDSLEQAFALNEAERLHLSQTAREHALKYDVERVFKSHMLPMFRAAEQRFRDREPVKLAARAA
jgi:glycosyltransferase involved in cell wall biosynthesis